MLQLNGISFFSDDDIEGGLDGRLDPPLWQEHVEVQLGVRGPEPDFSLLQNPIPPASLEDRNVVQIPSSEPSLVQETVLPAKVQHESSTAVTKLGIITTEIAREEGRKDGAKAATEGTRLLSSSTLKGRYADKHRYHKAVSGARLAYAEAYLESYRKIVPGESGVKTARELGRQDGAKAVVEGKRAWGRQPLKKRYKSANPLASPEEQRAYAEAYLQGRREKLLELKATARERGKKDGAKAATERVRRYAVKRLKKVKSSPASTPEEKAYNETYNEAYLAQLKRILNAATTIPLDPSSQKRKLKSPEAPPPAKRKKPNSDALP